MRNGRQADSEEFRAEAVKLVLERRHERRSSPAIRGEAKAILYPVIFYERL